MRATAMKDSKLANWLADQGIRFVRVLWCDNANIVRGKAFHVGFLEEHLHHGIGISMAQQAIPVMYDAVAPESGLGPVGEAWLVPDWETVQPLPYTPGHARVMSNLQVNGQPWALCPRAFLRRMIAQAAAAGFEIKAAFEHEFYVMRVTDEGAIAPVDQTVFASTLAMDLNHALIDEMAEALLMQGIPVERYYPESGPGQHEISIRYTQAMQAADWQIAFRETIRGVALRHGLRASFLPKLFANSAGSGCHLHLSLWQQGRNLMPNATGVAGLSEVALNFIAGILHHLPALMALTTPSSNSYRRLQPQSWSGAFCAWGVDNREAAVRVPSDPIAPTPTHFELKTVDASANPYLALGAVIAAGLDGIRHHRQPGEPVAVDPATLSEAERNERQIARLPENLGRAIAHLRQDSVLLEALGAPLAQAFLAVRTAEWHALKDLELEEEIKLLWERY